MPQDAGQILSIAESIAMILTAAGGAVGVYVFIRVRLQRGEDGQKDTHARLDHVETRLDDQDVTLRKVDVIANDISWIKNEMLRRGGHRDHVHE